MTALADRRGVRTKAFKYKSMLATAQTVFKGGRACIDLSTGLVANAAPSVSMLPIGTFAVDPTLATGGTVIASGGKALVELDHEVEAVWMVNSAAGVDAVAAGNIGSLCYLVDDQTVALTGANGTRSVAGRIWDVDSTRGVLVESLTDNKRLTNSRLTKVTLAAYTANDTAPADIVSGAIYDIPTTAAASTISLPATPGDGSWCVLFADGTKNGHTITVRDVATAITAALTASKRLVIHCYALNGHWNAAAVVGP